jgi:hypothetical protein
MGEFHNNDCEETWRKMQQIFPKFVIVQNIFLRYKIYKELISL